MKEQLGLFDAPPDRKEIRIAWAIVGLVFAILLAALPMRDVYLGPVTGLAPALNAAMLVCDLITAAILYAQAAVFRSRALTVLASGYVFAGVMLIPYSLSFPGAFSENGLLGARLGTTAWIATSWRLSIPIAILSYAWLKRGDALRPVVERSPARIVSGVLAAIALAILVTLLATVGHDLLPPYFINRSEVVRPTLIIVNVVTMGLTVAAMALLYRQERSVLDMWLLVALSAWLAQSLLNMLLHSRFTFGAYAFFGLVLVSNLSVMLALITESNRLYARLALSSAARERERHSRLTTMDAVAAAIAHEVAQPLTAASLGASNALMLLTDPEPDTEMATRSLRDAIEANHRTFEVIKSVRASFAGDAGVMSEFRVDDLVRETVFLMDRELAAQKIALRLALDESLPPVLANRVQIQRVLINLLTNAIEAIVAARRAVRFIAIRAAPLDGRFVLLDVRDSGDGIAAEKLPRIFEPFFTTKSAGTGLGLSLSRSIIEDHGGRMWASATEDHGAIFHVQLPFGAGAVAK